MKILTPREILLLIASYVGRERQEQLLAEELAAAEERGRRRGVEGAAKILQQARDWLEFMAAHPGDGDAKNLIARIDAALAPRDSAPVCDAVLSSDPFREWRCGKPKDHEGPHSGEAPRDSGKEPAKMDTPHGPTCWCGRFSKHESGWCGEYNCERSR